MLFYFDKACHAVQWWPVYQSRHLSIWSVYRSGLKRQHRLTLYIKDLCTQHETQHAHVKHNQYRNHAHQAVVPACVQLVDACN